MRNKKYRLIVIAAFTAALGVPVSSWGQAWPTKPVRVIVPFGPGGGTDIQARLIAKRLGHSLHQSFVVENRPGAGGMIGANIVAHSAPDGYTVLFATATLAVNATLDKKEIKFNPLKDLTPVCWVSSSPLVLVVNPDVPVKSVRGLVALAKKRSGKMNAGSDGMGSTSSLSLDMFKQMAGISVGNIPFNGAGPMLPAVLSGEIDFAFAPALTVEPQIKVGKLRALAVTTAKRSIALPDVPTMNSFYPGFQSGNWVAMFMPAGGGHKEMAIVSKLNLETRKALKAPDVQAFMKKQGIDIVGSTPKALGLMFHHDVAKYAKVIKAAHININ